ncbi:MAG: NRDE family protein [Alphaproteobacteria bacterium]
MCTIVLLRRPGHAWPLVLGANRDEMLDRPWRPPGRHWPEQPEVVAGRDESAGGTWLGVNDSGLVAAVSNRRGSLGPAPDKRSRGELPLAALAHGRAVEAAEALAWLDPGAYRAFNLVVADHEASFWLRNRGDGGGIERFEVPEGLSMLTAGELDDPESPRIRAFLPRFRAAPPPDPGAGDWRAWEALLASRETGAAGDPLAAMSIATAARFGTVSSSLIALPGPDGRESGPVWRFAAGRPDEAGYRTLTI